MGAAVIDRLFTHPEPRGIARAVAIGFATHRDITGASDREDFDWVFATRTSST